MIVSAESAPCSTQLHFAVLPLTDGVHDEPWTVTGCSACVRATPLTSALAAEQLASAVCELGTLVALTVAVVLFPTTPGMLLTVQVRVMLIGAVVVVVVVGEAVVVVVGVEVAVFVVRVVTGVVTEASVELPESFPPVIKIAAITPATMIAIAPSTHGHGFVPPPSGGWPPACGLYCWVGSSEGG